MKVIELDESHSLNEVVDLAQDELVVLRRPDGSVFALSHVDDFAVEVELLKHNAEFMALANHRKAIGVELAAYAERVRDIESAAEMVRATAVRRL